MAKPPVHDGGSGDAEAAVRLLLAWYKRLPPGAALGIAGCAAFFTLIGLIPREIVGAARVYTIQAFDVLAVGCALAAAYAIIREVIRRG